LTDDDALIRAAQGGDADAFEALLEAHYDTLYRFAYKWSGHPADADDITQQACIKLAGALSSYRFESAFTTWLYRVVVNCAKDWARAQGRHLAEPLEPALEQGTAEAVGEKEAVEHHVFLHQLLERLDQLPDGLKETLLLVHAEGLSHADAARVLDVKESTVSWRLHEFRKRYRLAIDGGGIEL
jgi:RNA polymerase sigma-70 factor (ECF subfamily)